MICIQSASSASLCHEDAHVCLMSCICSTMHAPNSVLLWAWQAGSSAPLDTLVRGRDWRKRVQAKLQVPRAPAEVVHDGHRVTARAQVQRRRPAAVPIPACSPSSASFNELPSQLKFAYPLHCSGASL